MEDLERDRPIVLQIVREVDRGHPAAPELPLEDIAGVEGITQLGLQLGHGRGLRWSCPNLPVPPRARQRNTAAARDGANGKAAARAETIPPPGGSPVIFPAMPARNRFVPVSQWRDARHRRGLRGELTALAYLTACGWSIEAHRFRLGRHDVDLVARRAGVVAFVEVKSRSAGGDRCGSAVEAVGPRKRAILARVAAGWLARHGRRGEMGRFDVVSVEEGVGGAVVVGHIVDAWRI
jgi:putative endonuclease